MSLIILISWCCQVRWSWTAWAWTRYCPGSNTLWWSSTPSTPRGTSTPSSPAWRKRCVYTSSSVAYPDPYQKWGCFRTRIDPYQMKRIRIQQKQLKKENKTQLRTKILFAWLFIAMWYYSNITTISFIT